MRSSTRGRLMARRTARRSSGLLPLIDRSMADRASRRRTPSIEIGESGISFFPAALRRAFSSISAMAKNGRRACTQHAASRIGPGLAVRQIQLVVTVIGVRLEDACVSRQMGLRMLAPAVARVMEDRGGRPGAAGRPFGGEKKSEAGRGWV